MSLNRVQVIWSGSPTNGGGLTTFYFNSSVGTAAQQVTAVGNFLAATEDQRSSLLSWQTAPDVATISQATGALEAVTTTTPSTGVGIESGNELSPTTQGLLRVLTTVVVGGRLLRGRIFLPGATEANSGAPGTPIAAYLTDYNTAGAALIADANTEWVVWSRSHGTYGVITTANMWTKWAVLRSRRD
jgi:hypothetical protein